MGCCSSTPKGMRWEQRWSSDSACKKTLQKFCKDCKGKKNGQAVVTGTSTKASGSAPQELSSGSGDVLRGIARDGEFRNWAVTVQTAPAKVFKPKSVTEVQDLLAQARRQRPLPKIRCMGSGHSWTPVFGDDGAWIFDTSGMKDLTWSADRPKEVTIGPGVTAGQLGTYLDAKERGKWRGLFLSSDVVLETVTYGGTINLGCHGTGRTQTLPDYVVKTTIIKWDGTQVDLCRADDPAGFALKVLHFGLLGITASFTLKLDDNLSAIRVTDAKVEARTLFLGKDVLPKPGGSNPLREAWHGGYAIEIFYFAASSLNITNIFSTEFEDQEWDPYSDICATKTFQRTNKAVKKDNDRFFGIDSKTSTRFDRNFGLTDFLKSNVGTNVALPLISKFAAKPALVALYSKAAARAFEPFGKGAGTKVFYETSLAQAIHWQKYISNSFPATDVEVCIKCDPDFASAYKAIHSTLRITKAFVEEENTFPLNVAMEIRFTKHSDSLMSPAYGYEGDVFMWIEILAAVITPRFKDYATRVADAWLSVRLKDGSQAAFPHWAKWHEAYVSGADAKMKRAYASRLPHLRRIAREFDPNCMFVNKFFAKLLSS